MICILRCEDWESSVIEYQKILNEIREWGIDLVRIFCEGSEQVAWRHTLHPWGTRGLSYAIPPYLRLYSKIRLLAPTKREVLPISTEAGYQKGLYLDKLLISSVATPFKLKYKILSFWLGRFRFPRWRKFWTRDITSSCVIWRHAFKLKSRRWKQTWKQRFWGWPLRVAFTFR